MNRNTLSQQAGPYTMADFTWAAPSTARYSFLLLQALQSVHNISKGTNLSSVPWMKRMGIFALETHLTASASFNQYLFLRKLTRPAQVSAGNAGRWNCFFSWYFSTSHADVYPQSSTAAFTLDGRDSPAAIMTVAAPMETPYRMISAWESFSIIQ